MSGTHNEIRWIGLLGESDAGPRRLLIKNGAFIGRRGGVAYLIRTSSGQQLVKQKTERVNIDGCRDRLASHLLGRRIFRSKHALDASVAGIVIDQFCDAEVEQFDLATMIDHQIRGFQIAMNDEVGMRMTYRRTDSQKQLETRVDTELVLIAIAAQIGAVDILQREPR